MLTLASDGAHARFQEFQRDLEHARTCSTAAAVCRLPSSAAAQNGCCAAGCSPPAGCGDWCHSVYAAEHLCSSRCCCPAHASTGRQRGGPEGAGGAGGHGCEREGACWAGRLLRVPCLLADRPHAAAECPRACASPCGMLPEHSGDITVFTYHHLLFPSCLLRRTTRAAPRCTLPRATTRSSA